MSTTKHYYDNSIVKAFAYATVIWAIIGFSLGLTVAGLLFFPQLPEYIFGSETIKGLFGDNIQGLQGSKGIMGFGRLRMLHTSAVIFAFVGNGMFAGVYYSMQRLLKTRMWNDTLSWINFWGWQLMLVLVVITFLMGISTTKEYAEHEWPIDILTAFVWTVFGINMFGTIIVRRVTHMYVAIWFYIATWIGIFVLHVFNNLALPVTLFKSYSIYAGVQDALVQWWYGHNAVAFFLTTPVLGMMYYFIPKASNRPVFSYKLSIIHFWSLIFVYIWAGPHHLQFTALPAWAQAVGTAFSIMLIAPSWGGMLNGLLTLRGAWDKVREDAILKFFVVAVTCYGMATFEGPLLATKTLNQIGHFTDWVIAHVHLGALGWNGFMIFGVLYWLIPKLFNTELYSKKMAETHFWLGTLGIILYVVPMYYAGFSQAQLWKQWDMTDGTLLNKNFLDTVTAIVPLYKMRFAGGILYISGAILMAINIVATARKGSFTANEEFEAVDLPKMSKQRQKGEGYHTWLERMPARLSIFSFLVLAIGGLVEIVPTIVVKQNVPTLSSVKPYTPLELEGRDIYIREACNACHSQVVRPFRDEVLRYGEYSKPGEYVYDRPFLWGSKRTGPDLHREGGKNPDSWHFKHMLDPRITSPGSIMPRYPWMHKNELDVSNIETKMKTLVKLNTPYTEKDFATIDSSMTAQASGIVERIYAEAPDVQEAIALQKQEQGEEFVPLEKREITALIAYLQRLGTDIKSSDTETASR